MAVYSPSPHLGAIGLTDDDLNTIREKDQAFYGKALDKFFRHARYFPIYLPIFTSANNNTTGSTVHIARFEFLVFDVEFSAETAAGTTGQMDLHKAIAATPTTFATMIEEVIDVKTGAGIQQSGRITSGKETFAIGDRLRALSISGSAAAQTGAVALVHAIRL